MFKNFRIKRLKEKITVQKAEVAALMDAEKDYRASYYTNRAIEAKIVLARLMHRLSVIEEER